MKKFLLPVLLLGMVICFTACGKKEETAVPSNSMVMEEVQQTVTKEPNVTMTEEVIEEPVETKTAQPR